MSSAAQINVPDGYTVELVASTPLVTYPIMAGFDERGRLFVAETAGLNLERKELEAQLPGYVTMLEDTDRDGKFDKSTRFADKLTFPQGALWHDGALYVASSGGLWRFRDADGDGVAEERVRLVGDFGYTGNAADIHGPFLHPNGRIYFVQGRHGHEVKDAAGKVVSQSKAGGIFSIRPDGSDFHRHATGGFDNPVELIFTDEGEVLGVVNILEHTPRQDCLVHWVEGGLYPRRDFVKQWDEFVSTGDLLPPVMSFGHVAVSGLCRSRSRDGEAFVTLFNTHEVRRVKITRKGSTFEAQDEKFLSSPQQDFHPTDVLEDKDGSLLVLDTGGWFRIGCPTSQVAKPEALGAIYRVRKTNPSPPLAASRTTELWSAIRAGGERGARAVREGLNDPNESIRHVAAHGAGVLRDAASAPRLAELAKTDTQPIRREAATALGFIGQPRSVPALLASLRDAGDRFVEHSVIHALIRIHDPPATAAGLADAHPGVHRGALIALDRMSTQHLQPQQVIAALDTDDTALRSAAMDILVRHPGWSDQAVGVLRDWLSRPSLSVEESSLARGVLAAFAAEPAVLDLIAATLTAPGTPHPVRIMVLDVLANHAPQAAPPALAAALTAALNSDDAELLLHTVLATQPMSNTDFDPKLSQVAADTARDPRLRIAAIQSLTRRGGPLGAEAFALLLSELEPTRPLLNRRDSAQVIAHAKLDAAQLAAVVAPIRQAGPIELPLLFEAFERPRKVGNADELFAALAESPGLSSLNLQRIEKLAKRLGATASAQPLVTRLRREVSSQRTRLEELERSLTRGDAAAGKSLFFSKATCFVCHRVRGEGGTIGPDLSTIGAIRARRDLLESVTFPSASFARGYEPMIAALNDGQNIFGRITRESQDAIVLADPQGAEHRIPRDQIKQLKTTATSLMPMGLERLLTPQELSDLLEYLGSLR